MGEAVRKRHFSVEDKQGEEPLGGRFERTVRYMDQRKVEQRSEQGRAEVRARGR
jgi:hypothetical protein